VITPSHLAGVLSFSVEFGCMEQKPAAQEAVEPLRQLLIDFDRIHALRTDDPEVGRWMATTVALLRRTFGYTGYPGGYEHGMTTKFISGDLLEKRAVLESCIKQLEMLSPPAAVGSYHAEIKFVTAGSLRNGYYSIAVLEAYTRVIDEVRQRSGSGLYGETLMSQAFAWEGRSPLLRYYSNHPTRDELEVQRGFLYLFKGIAALQNSRAQSIRLFYDPARAHEHLALASLLMHFLELAS